MPRVDLDTYYKGFFKNSNTNSQENFREINRAHVISSKYYDIQFGRNSLMYRDKTHTITIPVEHDIKHTVVIYLNYFFEKNACDFSQNYLKRKISIALDFLKVKYQFE